jgi:chemotaxis family two-component system response regulator Rcp1
MDQHERIRPVEILLVEDSPTDALLTKEALRFSKLCNNLHHVMNGVEAMAFMRKQDQYVTCPSPDLILLDINLPKMNGHEVLKELKSNDQFQKIPIIVLTTSSHEADVLKAYGLHANCYITKPVDFGKFAQIVTTIETFWFAVVTLPPQA